MIKYLRITVRSFTPTTVVGITGQGDEVRVCLVPPTALTLERTTASAAAEGPLIAPTFLYPGAQLNLLLSETLADSTLLPQHIVLNPDFLVDVTSICRCFTHAGDSPAMHILSKFMPSAVSAAIMLGNVANQFLDDCVNLTEPRFAPSLTNAFCSDPLRFSAIGGIDQQFTDVCRKQFANIAAVVTDWHTQGEFSLDTSHLESAFICEPLGIQGRMDLVSADLRHIVELKSGRGEEFGQPADQPGFKYEHALQMALYKESLYYNHNLPYASVHTSLLYSRYPSLQEIHLGRTDIHRAIAVRNGIVHLEHLLQHRSETLLGSLTEDHFNVRGLYDKFYCSFIRPDILSFLAQIQQAPKLEQAYFHTFLGFVQREQNLAKTGVEGVSMAPGHGGFADVWRLPAASKLRFGNLIPNLHIKPVCNEQGVVAIEAELAEPCQANFRPGDMVMLHPQAAADADLTVQQQAASMYTSCVIQLIDSQHLLLRLRYPQRSARLFDTSRLYAVEPTHTDSTYTTLYRGLYAFLSAPQRRRDLLLARKQPEFDPTCQLVLPIDDPEGADITLRAKQAKDYFLLVGPPGTGKTSVALRRMVDEFMASTATLTSVTTAPDSTVPSLLLMAYTNRAVDEICGMLAQTTHAEQYLRIGSDLSCAPPYRHRLLMQMARSNANRFAVRSLLQRTPIIVGTVATISMNSELFLLKQFRAAIVDEASQVLEPQLLPLWCATCPNGSSAIGKFILIGDHKQLPAVVTQPADESAIRQTELTAIGLTDCRDSLFERLHRLATRRDEPHTVALLRRQGRMHPALSQFVSKHYYGGLLAEVPLPHQLSDLEWSRFNPNATLQRLLATHRLGFFHIEPIPAPPAEKSNTIEALLAAHLVQAIHQLCIQNQIEPDWPHRLGIIVPFRSQITLIRNSLAQLNIPCSTEINIDTVERYQGSQRDIILFTTTVSTAWGLSILSAPVESDNGPIDRKLNVAITRARKQFFIIGNPTLLRQSEPYRQLLDSIPCLGVGFPIKEKV